ncbi:hypothetical protein BGZ65_009723, partial [Modicella reniformis]
MRFAQLYSIPLTAALVAQALPQVLAAVSKIPPGSSLSDFAFVENQGLYISDAWTNLTRRETKQESEGQGIMTITKDGGTLIFVDNRTIHNYDIKSNQWGQDYFMNWTYLPFGGGIVTDLDTGLVYGIELPETETDVDMTNPNVTWKFTEFNPANKSFTYVEKKGSSPYPRDWVSMIYSSAAKRIFGYEDGRYNDKATLWSYNTTSKDWTKVPYGGKKVTLAGGLEIKQGTAFNDVYSFDVSTLVWTRLPNMPQAVLGQSCAVSGDSFIFMGGLVPPSEMGKDGKAPANDEGPAILNLTSNTW